MLQWLERNRSNLAVILVVLVAVAAAVLLQLPRRSVLQVTYPSSPQTPPPIKVHVVGAVVSPGVYQLAADARVEEALKAAGGPSESADLMALNLATPLRDGQQVIVPQTDSQPVPVPTSRALSSPTPRSGKLDLNSATRAELDALPGIGEVLSQRILDYRAKNGGIRSADELRDAKILNSATYEKIRDLVEVR